MKCECPVAGYCNRYQKSQGTRAHEICQNINVSPKKRAVYLRDWEVAKSPNNPNTGPGAELKKLLVEFGINNFAGCRCEERSRQMNLWGVDGCRENFNTIRGWIVEAQTKADWLTTIKAAALATASGIATQIDLRDIAGSLVRIAIERAANAGLQTPG